MQSRSLREMPLHEIKLECCNRSGPKFVEALGDDIMVVKANIYVLPKDVLFVYWLKKILSGNISPTNIERSIVDQKRTKSLEFY